MWRRIHSNRDPRETLYRELRKEFAGYFDVVGVFSKRVFERWPKFIFSVMVIAMAASLILTFTLLRHPEPMQGKAVKPIPNPDPVQDGFGKIMQTAGQIRETIALKHLVDSITAKRQLSAPDSLALDSALSRLQQIHNNLK
jgi:hypothetical protein